jgi:hypothetical protein
MDLPVVAVVASAISLTDGGSALMMSPGMGNSWHRGGHGGACGVETQHTFFVIFWYILLYLIICIYMYIYYRVYIT